MEADSVVLVRTLKATREQERRNRAFVVHTSQKCVHIFHLFPHLQAASKLASASLTAVSGHDSTTSCTEDAFYRKFSASSTKIHICGQLTGSLLERKWSV